MAPTISHVGMTVGDIHAAIEFYRNVFGCEPIGQPFHVKRDGSYMGELYVKVLDDRFKESYVVFLSTADHAVLELFEFKDPEVEVLTNHYPYWQTGVSHICFVREDIETAVEEIVKHGGRDRMGVLSLFDKSNDVKIAYCEDPWGNLIELFNVDNPGLFEAAIRHAAAQQGTAD